MGLHLRQICLVARRLEPAVRDLGAVLHLAPVFVDPAVSTFGLENTLLGVGSGFLEVVAPVREGTTAGRYLERRGGDGGYMVICQTTDAATQADVRARAAAESVRVVFEHVDGTHHYMQLHPGDLEAAFLEVDWEEHGELDGFWAAAGGRAWQEKARTDVVKGFAGVALQSADPEALAARWSRVTGLAIEREGDAPHLRLERARIRFVEARDGRGPGLAEVDLVVADRSAIVASAEAAGVPVEDDAVTVCGTRFRLV